jgi:hypothetical protein
LQVGVDTITANYDGDSQYGTSSSSATVIVQKVDTSVLLTSSPTSSSIGQAVLFTATVTPLSPGGGFPSGTITFKDGNTIRGTAQITDGRATFSTTSLPPGQDSITAAYSGDADFTTSASVPLNEMVKWPDTPPMFQTTTKLTVSPKATKVGQRVTLTAKVKTQSGFEGTPTGEVVFMDGAITLEMRPLRRGTATMTFSKLPPGLNHIQADYPGNQSFDFSVSNILSEKVTAKQRKKKPAARKVPISVRADVRKSAVMGVAALAPPNGLAILANADHGASGALVGTSQRLIRTRAGDR